MLTYADVCCRYLSMEARDMSLESATLELVCRLTYADVSSCTYADVC